MDASGRIEPGDAGYDGLRMIYSSACTYAIRGLVCLARIRPDGYVLLDQVCADGDLPRRLLARIFLDLARKGLLCSAKGRGGGYRLSRTPSQISLFDIVSFVDGPEKLERCGAGLARCDDQQSCPLHDQYTAVCAEVRGYLRAKTLDQLVKAQNAR